MYFAQTVHHLIEAHLEPLCNVLNVVMERLNERVVIVRHLVVMRHVVDVLLRQLMIMIDVRNIRLRNCRRLQPGRLLQLTRDALELSRHLGSSLLAVHLQLSLGAQGCQLLLHFEHPRLLPLCRSHSQALLHLC